MDFARKYWTTIRAQAESLPLTSKLLIGALVVILLGVAGLGVLYAGKAQTVPISAFAGTRSEEVMARLGVAGIDAELRNGAVYVPAGQQMDAIALLAREELLSDNASSAFSAVTGNPWETDAQGDRKHLLATQAYLSAVARKFGGVRSAEVIIALPERRGFGRSSVRPSASVTVTTSGSGGVDKHLVASLAGLVSGAVAEMQPQDVVVLDARQGRQHKVDDPDDLVPTEVIELVNHQEQYHRKKIEDMLRHIPGVIVAVKVKTNPVRREVREERKYSDSEPLRSEENTEMTRRDVRRGGEAGTRPNTGMSIAGDGGDVQEETETTTRTEFGDKLLTSTAQIEMAGHQVEQINATINVPRSYFVSIFRANQPPPDPAAAADLPAAPDDAALDAIRTAQLDAIRSQVTPLIEAKAPGVVEANMVYDQAYLAPVAAGAGGGVMGVVGNLGGGDTVATAAAAGLGALSLLLAFMLVRRSTQTPPLPSLEELAGVPPTLPSDEELMGEASVVETAMDGVEIDEEELKSRHLAEQISELIVNSPADATGLLGRWVNEDD